MCRIDSPTAIIFDAAILVLSAVLGRAEPSKAGTDACSVLSKHEVQRALGVRVNDGQPRVKNGNVTGCWFPARHGEVLLLVRRNAPQVWVDDQVQRMNGPGKSSRFRTVAGLGKRAYRLDIGKSGTVLCVFGGQHYVQVAVLRAVDAEAALQAATQMVRTVLPRLVPLTSSERRCSRSSGMEWLAGVVSNHP